MLGTAKPNTSVVVRKVESDGARRRRIHGPKEICEVRAEQKSAEVIVALTPRETPEERRTEG